MNIDNPCNETTLQKTENEKTIEKPESEPQEKSPKVETAEEAVDDEKVDYMGYELEADTTKITDL